MYIRGLVISSYNKNGYDEPTALRALVDRRVVAVESAVILLVQFILKACSFFDTHTHIHAGVREQRK